MTNAEVIAQFRAEIERRIALYSSLSENTVNPNRIDEDRQLLSFISDFEKSLPAQSASGSSGIPKNLAIAAASFAFGSLDEVVLYGCTLSGRQACFIAGGQWVLERMMVDAVDGTMYEQPDGTSFLDCQLSFPAGMFNHEEKVRIVIVKED